MSLSRGSAPYPCLSVTRRNSTCQFVLRCAVFKVRLFFEHFLDGAFNSKAIHQTAELLGCKFPGLIGSAWPLEPVPCKKPFCQKQHSVAFEQEAFDSVSPVSAEQEQCSFFCCIQAIIQADKRCKSLDSLTEISASATDDDTVETDSFLKHG